MTRKKAGPKDDGNQKMLTNEQRASQFEMMDLKKSNPRTRSTSPTAMHCLHNRASPPKPKRKPKLKNPPSITPDQLAAQVSARIAELSHPPPKTPPSVKVKSHAELQSSKIARLTTKIAVTEVEIQRLKREQVKAQNAVQRSLEEQRSAALAILERRAVLEKAIREGKEGNGDGNGEEAEVLRGELESSFEQAKEALARGQSKEAVQALTQKSLLTDEVAKTGENVMDKVLNLFQNMEKDVKQGTISENAKMVLDVLTKGSTLEVAKGDDKETILEALAKALTLEEGKVKK
ncbi:hypothetical protein FKW77_005528 [Venturia effusa]|uniref:Uncharacterized protein n=1 Tax=Venturia effusa TaxID=50376 RepID=A0A517LQ65_9PEZI|nr:hypothetical protein FKW77_005528 [Venturia effusa]